MKSKNAIEVRNVTKKFRIYRDKGQTLKEKTLFRNRRSYNERTVLDHVSFEITKGEAVGLIGHNGCGKSTILKLLAQIMYPDSGTVEMHGRVSSLIELGAGFHPDLSGRENIYINASIFGLTKKEIARRMGDIIEFSELEAFIDYPVRTYSSGMYMRLAFAVAMNVDADILLIDEILAVGDAGFQAKCMRKLREIKGNGTTIVIVSHSAGQIEQICKNTIWVNDGKVQEIGLSAVVLEHYLDDMGAQHKDMKDVSEETTKGNEIQKEITRQEETSSDMISLTEAAKQRKKTKIQSVSLVQNGKKTAKIKCGESVDIEIEYVAEKKELDQPLVGLKLFRNDGVVCYGTNTQREGIHKLQLCEKGKIICRIEKMNLIAGEYWIDVALRNSDMMPLDYAEKGCIFEVYTTVDEIGFVRLDHKWMVR